jgi:phosphoglycerate dehydrogenase-like enzyme
MSADEKKTHRVLFALNREEREMNALSAVAPVAGEIAVDWLDTYKIRRPRWEKTLARLRPTILVSGWSTPPLSEGYVRDPDCPLEYVCHLFGSVRTVVPRAFLERGGCATNWGEAAAGPVAEHALLLALGALRNVRNWDGYIRNRKKIKSNALIALGARTLFGRKVGIHGFGRIARELVRLLQPFGVAISAYSAGVPEEFFRKHGVTPANSLEQLFAGSEVLFECEALTPLTKGTVTARVLAALPDQAVFVNVGRGRLLDEKALVKQALSGRIRIALDVIINEPLTARSRVMAVPDALLSPHIAGPTMDRFRQIGAAAMENIARHMAGKPLQAQVTLHDYDRST